MTTSINPEHDTIYESTHTEESEPSWWWDEGVPGVGEKPEFLGDKYKSVADKAKAHSELEKRLGIAPKEYDLSKGESWVDPDYGPLQDMLSMAKSKHVSQDVIDSMMESVGKYLDEFKIDKKEELSKLGDKALERLQVLDNWAQSNFSKESYEALTTNLNTADAIKALEEVRVKMNTNATTIPTGHAEGAAIPSLQDIQSEMNKNIDKYKTDPIYRREMLAKMEAASKNSGYMDKEGFR